MTRILHCADIHFDPRAPEPALASLRAVRDTVADQAVELVVLAGDLFDRPVRSADADGMPDLLAVVAEILEEAPVVAVYGTPSHDAPGAYAPLVRMGARHRFVAIGPAEAGVPYVLDQIGSFYPFEPWALNEGPGGRAIITGLPEPTRRWLLAGDAEAIGRAEATEAVATKLRQLLAGIGAQCSTRATVPHIHVQHGEVAGATTAAGQTLPPGGIAVRADDLALTGADYIALGHIHAYQRVADRVPAWYAGSAYPVDWGERDQKAFSLVDVEAGKAPVITRHPYPHAPRAKYVWTVDRPEYALRVDLDDDEIAGRDVWVVVQHPAECDPGATGEQMRARLQDLGAGEVRIDFEAQRAERVRAPAITKADCWADQVRAWGAATATEIATEHAEAVAALEAELARAGEIPQPRRWRLRSLRLRGAIGIWRGTGQDEIEIDLDDYDPGLVALTGPNGAGKTTLLENLTPWPALLTRSGALAEHFRLRDSYRDLRVTDDATGEDYRFVIQVDPVSGRCEHQVYGDGVPLAEDGSKAAYLAQVERLWGPRSLYLLSMCTPQTPVPIRIRGEDGDTITATTDLATASRGMRRAIFRQMLGLGAYQAGARRAGERRRMADEQADRLVARAAPLEEPAAAVADLQRRLDDLATAESAASRRVAELGTDVARQREEVDRTAQAARDSTAAAAQVTQVDAQIRSLREERNELERTLPAHEAAMAGRADADLVLGRASELTQRRDELSAERMAALAAADLAIAERRSAVEAMERETTAVRRGLDDLRDRRSRAQARIVEMEAQRTGDGTECRACGQTLPPEQLAERQTRQADLERRLDEGQRFVADLDERIAERQQAVEAWESKSTTTEPSQGPVYDDTELRRVTDEIGGLDLRSAQATVQLAARAEGQIEQARMWGAQIERDLEALESRRGDLSHQIDPEAEERHHGAGRRLDELSARLGDARAEQTRVQADLEHVRSEHERATRAAAQLAEIQSQVHAHREQAETWRLLEAALGPDGVQSLILEAAAPAISRVATDLLGDAYGRRWQVRIELQRPSGTGSRRRMIEDLRIVVRDTTAHETWDDDLGPGEQLLETLSGGEGVWVRAALSAAIGAIRAQQTRQQFRTALLDEADDGLDEQARGAYYRLIEAAHRTGDRHQTVVITHSDVQYVIDQRIEIGDVAASPSRVNEEEAA